jgi:nucleotide-binding universal stress UspA family protein
MAIMLYKRILVPLDGSELAERALPHAAEIARRFEGNIWLVRVSLAWEYVQGPAGAMAPYSDVVLERDRETAVEYLSHIGAHLARPGLRLTTEVLSGPVAEAIVDYARTEKIDLIVMSTHGRSGLSRWVYGSVADKVLRGAHCPTLIIRGEAVE